ncbi:DUF3343 domain-containing protein [Alkaliphilus sp. B6464]|uniref:DUF3343 domain-containing protein n=1 Tax=Alkaliphilus sp. B6464 TaxID=2731219 RepID=UPI0020131768|nr:DUF3343 domain-containing protein [Alkaliphilus sp. B6464]
MVNLKERYCVITFHSTYQALRFEKILKENNCEVRLIPVPRQVSTSCGTAGEIPCNDKEIILRICRENYIDYGEFHCIEKEAKPSWYTKLIKREKC